MNNFFVLFLKNHLAKKNLTPVGKNTKQKKIGFFKKSKATRILSRVDHEYMMIFNVMNFINKIDPYNFPIETILNIIL